VRADVVDPPIDDGQQAISTSTGQVAEWDVSLGLFAWGWQSVISRQEKSAFDLEG
jgi:hypothetical protein